MQFERLVTRRARLSRAYELIGEYSAAQNGYARGNKSSMSAGYLLKLLEYQFLPHYFSGIPRWRTWLRSFGGKRTLPDFCIIGPIKSGTSDLAVNMLLHPNVLAPLAKEFEGEDPDDWRIFYPTERAKARHAARHGGCAMSPYLAPYLHYTEMGANLARRQPHTKIVLTLREPAARMYSHWKWEVFWAGRALAKEMPILQSFAAYADEAIAAYQTGPLFTAVRAEGLQTSIYAEAVSEWINAFGPDNVLVLDVADYFAAPTQFVARICAFVGLPPFDCPSFDQRINENPLSLPPADPATHAKLQAFFRPHNARLWKVLGHSFSWDD